MSGNAKCSHARQVPDESVDIDIDIDTQTLTALKSQLVDFPLKGNNKETEQGTGNGTKLWVNFLR